MQMWVPFLKGTAETRGRAGYILNGKLPTQMALPPAQPPSPAAFPTVVDCILGAKGQNKAFFLRVVCAKYSRDEKG